MKNPPLDDQTTPVSELDEGLAPEVFDRLDEILDELRTRYDETPQWEFCEGFMAALICCRRLIPSSEYLPVLLGLGRPTPKKKVRLPTPPRPPNS
jgi:uncharacterized protein